ncbi:MAG: hypothetical protein AB7D38_07105 [Sulfurimonas sp.]|uniref:hypothetical protein n=1 Tax=Sulfurimonas sp. TaxID=2022749 RepID=UPI003D0DA557
MSNEEEIGCDHFKSVIKLKYYREGSGIIFLPTTESPYAYILTAKHNFKDENEKLIPLKEIDNEKVKIDFKEYDEDSFINIAAKEVLYLDDADIDLAIIIVEVSSLNKIILKAIPILNILDNQFSHCIFKGYPEILNNNIQCIQSKYHAKTNRKLFTIKSDNNLSSFDFSEYDNTVGFSGSGLLTAFNKKPVLAGVIVKVNNSFSEIDCIDLKVVFQNINEVLNDRSYTKINIIESESIELSRSNEIETLKGYQTNLTTDLNISDQHKEIIEKLESYDIEGAKKLLRDISEPSGETYRLNALVALTDKDMPLAFSYIENAKNKEVVPNDLEFVKGLVYYFSSIDKKGYKRISPYPIDRLYIKRDQLSQENIFKAQEIFLELSSKNENTDYDVWYLASLHLTDLEKTEEKVKELIEKNPLNYGVITYTMAFDFDVDLSTSIQKLEEIKDKSINNIIDLVNCYNHHKLFEKTIILLKENETSFDKNSELLEKCYVNTYMLDKKFDEALKIISVSKNESIKNLESIVNVERYYSNAQWDDLISYYEKDLDTDNLYNICKIKAIQNDWEFISEKADELLEKLPLFEVLDLVVTAKYNSKKYKDVLQILESYNKIYFVLNEKLKRIKSHCLYKLGKPLESALLLDSLQRKTPNDIFALIDISRKIGDSTKVESLVSDFYIKNQNNLNVREKLQLGNLVKDDSPNFANKIYQNALSEKITEEEKAGLILEALEMPDRKLFEEIVKTPYVAYVDLGDEIRNAIEQDQSNIYQNYLRGNISAHKLNDQNYFIESLNPENKKIFFSRAGNRVAFISIDSKIKNIYCDISSLLFIDYLDLFENIFNVFENIYIPMNTIEYINNIQNTTLKNILNYYIKEGKVFFTNELSEDDLNEDTSVYLLEKSLQYLFKTDIKENSVILFDDRFLNKFSRTDKADIFAINDLLYTFFTNDLISENLYYQKLLSLREKNIMYISFSVDELIYHLQKAPIENDKLIETAELEIIRKHFAHTVQNFCYLSIKDKDKNMNMSEMYFFTNTSKLIANIYIELWNIDKEKWDIYVNYANENFYVLNYGYFLKDAVDNLNTNRLVSLSLSSLLYVGFFNTKNEQTKYINKIENRFLEPILYSNRVLFNEFINTLKIQLLQNYEYGEKDQKILDSLQVDFIKKLPFKIRNKLIEDEKIRERFDLTYPMKLRDKTINFDDLVIKIDSVLNNNKKEEFEDFEIYIEENEVLVKNTKTSDINNFADDFYMLSQDKKLRREVFEKNEEWIDCKKSKKRAIIKDIQSTTNAIKRFKKFEQYKKLSAEPYYKSLFDESNKKHLIDFNFVIPEGIELVSNYFRFELINDFDKNKKIAIKELLNDSNLSKTLHKIFALPQELPSQVYKKLNTLSHKKQVKLLKKYHNTVATPLNIFHLVNLINKTAKNKKFAKRVIGRILNKFSKDTLVQIKAYLTVYKYMFYRFKSEFDIEKNLLYMLSWGHADRIFRNFLALGIDSKYLDDIFTQKTRFDSSEVFAFENRTNILHPSALDDVSFLFKGLNYALKDDFEGIELSIFSEYTLIKDSKIPSYKLLKDFSLLENKCDSFMNKDYKNLFSYIDKSEGNVFSNSFLASLTNDTITDLKNTPDKVELYNMLKAIFDNVNIYKENKDDLLELMKNIDFDKIVDDYYMSVLNFISIQNIYLRDESLDKSIKKEMIKKCREITTEKELSPYFDILVYLSVASSEKIEDRVLYFTNLLRKIETDENRNLLKTALSNIAMQLPLNESNILAEYLVELRTK